MDSVHWQRNKNLKERMEIMLSHELNTDVTFIVSTPHSGKKCKSINSNKKYKYISCAVFRAFLNVLFVYVSDIECC